MENFSTTAGLSEKFLSDFVFMKSNKIFKRKIKKSFKLNYSYYSRR